MMIYLALQTIEAAPETRKALLQRSGDNFGWIRNLAEFPALLSVYPYAHERFWCCPLNEQERTIV
ncbi:hypothetical protein LHK94_07225 [Dickeya zeae]|uniref:hypothetical protein n=1 Tax=Dickeya zeae TaxID=204042 RepID=UPI001CF96054|nr:hypothetical protein [Dickeya zeae]UCZ76765.1 hypothetical protein LHK94_07225 [Dickeya zeae]